MSAREKPRGDAKLKRLPEERQAALFDYLEHHTQEETLAWLKEDGVSTSKRALSEFYAWYSLQQQFAEDEATTDSLLQELKREVPEIKDEELDALGQRTFSLLSLRRQDLGGFLKVRGARFKGLVELEKLKLRQQAEERHQQEFRFEREKWVQESCHKILVAATDERTRQIVEMQVPNAEKLKLLRAHWFADVDELEKSGAVKLPPLKKN